jgi:hypothetical protein
MGTQPLLGGKTQTGVHNPLYGQNVTQNPWHIPFPGNPLFSGGQNPQGQQQPSYSHGSNIYLPHGLTHIRLRDRLLTLLKGKMFILLMGK